MNIGFIGLGTMGAPMATRLVDAGHRVTVHNRTRAREEPLAAHGARRAASPAAAAAGAELVVTMVADTPDVEEVVFGDHGVASAIAAGALLVDMSTIAPGATRAFAERLAASTGAAWLDAPVSGGSEGAVRGTLSIMVGGDAADLERARPALAALGSTITHVGPSGAGQVAKAMNQVIIAGTYAAVAEGLVLGLKAGIDVGAAMAALAGGAAGSWGLLNRGPNVVRNAYPLGFRVRLHRKDLGIALDAARELGVPLPLAALVEQWETGLITRGHGDEDVSAIGRVVREQAGLGGPGSDEA
ncbi:MAG: NAD(P)-dependent oxidoreductase [Trueperaceae bacterium]|nr:NAD(P)-dependent oxidoreductase [Trueperaceae bacterium]